MRTSELARTTPLKRTPIKRTRKRPTTKVQPRPCSVRGCTKTTAPVIVGPDERYCEKHGTARADDAVREWFRYRYPRCAACGRSDEGTQWAHIHTRDMRYIRWDTRNAVSLCARCHFAYTKRPAAWVKWVELNYPGLYTRLLHRELWGDRQGGSVDAGLIIRLYRAAMHTDAPLVWQAPDPPDGEFR